VRNPEFEPVRTKFKVRFMPGYDGDPVFYINQLRREIIRFLSPWAFPGGGSPSFGGKIYKSVLINFVEERPYVDYVADFQLFHHITDFEGNNRRKIDQDEIEPSTAVSILVSVPEKTDTPANKMEIHDIEAIPPAIVETTHEKCPCES